MSQPANHLDSRQAQPLVLHGPADPCAHTKPALLSCCLTKKQNVLHALLHPRNAFLSPAVIALKMQQAFIKQMFCRKGAT